MAKNHTVVTISREVHKLAEECREEYNRVIGWKKFRSLSHFFEIAVVEKIEELKKEMKSNG